MTNLPPLPKELRELLKHIKTEFLSEGGKEPTSTWQRIVLPNPNSWGDILKRSQINYDDGCILEGEKLTPEQLVLLYCFHYMPGHLGVALHICDKFLKPLFEHDRHFGVLNSRVILLDIGAGPLTFGAALRHGQPELFQRPKTFEASSVLDVTSMKKRIRANRKKGKFEKAARLQAELAAFYEAEKEKAASLRQQNTGTIPFHYIAVELSSAMRERANMVAETINPGWSLQLTKELDDGVARALEIQRDELSAGFHSILVVSASYVMAQNSLEVEPTIEALLRLFRDSSAPGQVLVVTNPRYNDQPLSKDHWPEIRNRLSIELSGQALPPSLVLSEMPHTNAQGWVDKIPANRQQSYYSDLFFPSEVCGKNLEEVDVWRRLD